MMFVKDQSGLALPTTIIIILVLTLLGIALFRYSMAETKQVAWDEDNLRAHYLARSGADSVAAHLIKNPDDAEMLINQESGRVNLGEGQFWVFVTGDPDDEVHIQSTGNVGQAEQTVVLTLADDGPPAIYSTGLVTVSGNFLLSKGDLSFKDSIVNPGGQELDINDVIDNHLEDGEVYQQDLTMDPVVLPCEDNSEGAPFYGTCPTEAMSINSNEISVSGYYGSISLKPNDPELLIKSQDDSDMLVKVDDISIGKMKVELNNNIIALVTDDFNVSNNGHMEVSGNGYLLIYVQGEYYGRGTFKVDPDSDANTIVFVGADGSFDLSGNTNFDGAVYAPDATVSISGNVTVNGWIIGSGVELDGNSKMQYDSTVSFPPGLFLDFKFYRVEKYRYEY